MHDTMNINPAKHPTRINYTMLLLLPEFITFKMKGYSIVHISVEFMGFSKYYEHIPSV